jgi:hypothetical protein
MSINFEELASRVAALPHNSVGNKVFDSGLRRDLCENYHRSGLHLSAFAAKVGISPGTIDYWLRHDKRKLRQQPKSKPSPSFKRIEISPEVASLPATIVVRMANGMWIEGLTLETVAVLINKLQRGGVC